MKNPVYGFSYNEYTKDGWLRAWRIYLFDIEGDLFESKECKVLSAVERTPLDIEDGREPGLRYVWGAVCLLPTFDV